MTSRGRDHTRRKGESAWVPVATSSSTPTQSATLNLMLVRQRQSPGEPCHWSLYVACEGQIGTVYQVKGDAIGMRYIQASDIDPTTSASYKDSFNIAQLTPEWAQRVAYWANNETPPSAQTQAAVRENCQGWTIRVMERLVQEGIVAQNWLTQARNLQEPLK